MPGKFVIYDGCVAPAALVPFLKKLKARTGCHYNSIYRGDGVDLLLNKLGKHSQRQLFDGFQRGLPGYLPANRPGTSTHELKSDGVAYPNVPVGHDLVWWQCGLDVNDDEVEKVKREAAKFGWEVWQPYPGTREVHHLNFKRKPDMPKPAGTYSQWAKWYRGGRKGKRPNVPQTISDLWWAKLKRGDK